MRTIADLTPDPRNANKGTPRGRALLEQSLRKLGAGRSILVDKHGVTIAGNKTLEIAAELGLAVREVETDGNELVVVRRMDLDLETDVAARELGVADNRASEVGLSWDGPTLEELGIDLKPWFFEEELKELGVGNGVGGDGGLVNEGPDPQLDRAEELREKWGTSEGQIWQLGRHLIACLDCKKEENIKRVFSGAVNFVWADPPYGISIVAINGYVDGGEAYDIPFGGVKKQRGNVGGGERIKASPGLYPIQMRKQGLGSVGAAKPFGSQAVRGSVGAANRIDVGKYAPVIGDDTIETAQASSRLFLSLYPKAIQVWWGANYYAHVLPPSSCWIVWDKENTGNFADAELAWCSEKSAVRIFKHMWNGLMKDSERGMRRVHPTQKPVALAAWAFEKYGSEGDVIVDPFLGSGISVIAAEQIPGERKVVGFELSPDYIAVMLERWSTFTSQEPQLL